MFIKTRYYVVRKGIHIAVWVAPHYGQSRIISLYDYGYKVCTQWLLTISTNSIVYKMLPKKMKETINSLKQTLRDFEVE